MLLATALQTIVVTTDFLPKDPEPAPFAMEITLAQYQDEKKPEKAISLAHNNQQKRGEQKYKSEITAMPLEKEQIPEDSEFSIQQFSQPKAIDPIAKITKRTNTASNTLSIGAPPKCDSQEKSRSFLNNNLDWEIQQLESTLDETTKKYANRPRIDRLTASSKMSSIQTNYVNSVVSKIEARGKEHFPVEAGKKLYGKLKVAISIYSDGSIKSVEILQSSGNLVLDSKTKDIVHHAAPFAPFPKELGKEVDILVLTRTFSYSRTGVASF